MRRREFITLLGGAVATCPLTARAQQPAVPVVGFLDPGSLESNRGTMAQFRRALADAGYIDGKTVAIEWRWGNNQPDRLKTFAAELVDLRVAVIVASGAVESGRAAKAATSIIPIVLSGGADPVKYGLVASLNRPGGNVTGVTSIHNELAGKRLDMLRQMVPQATTIGYLIGDERDDEIDQELTSDMLAAARALGLQVVAVECRNEPDLESAFATFVERRVGALVVSAFALAFNNRTRILALAERHKIPAIYPQTQYAIGGGLMSYSAVGTLRQVGFYYVPQILKGAKPADLPVQQPTRFYFVINRKTARALALDIPRMLLALADQLIE